MPKVSISVACFNNLAYTKQCLKALFKNTSEDLFELIVIDNASDDGTSDWIKNEYIDKGKRVILIKNSSNLGFAKAHNQASIQAKGEIFIPLNNDTIPLKGWLEPMLEALEFDGVGIVGSKLLLPTGRLQHAGVVFMDNGCPYHYHFNELPTNVDNTSRIMPSVTGACIAIKMPLFKKMGCFSELYLNGWEDTDLVLRIRKETGLRAYYCAESVLYHYEGRTEGRFIADNENKRIFFKEWLQQIFKWREEDAVGIGNG